MIENKRMDIFDAPVNSMLVHACNCKGVWGSGIAAIFREKFPNIHKEYQNYCQTKTNILGTSSVWFSDQYSIGCLFTSDNFGQSKDQESMILDSTKTALLDIFNLAKFFGILNIYSNKFNSGLFGVPWYKSEKILVEISQKFPEINWTVCDWP